ncbi:MAG: hypothetical protein KDI56_17590, partial [Xanthomonadales bacterium]|nr:hypothetical protein [Xanthomonadales bacterium]
MAICAMLGLFLAQPAQSDAGSAPASVARQPVAKPDPLPAGGGLTHGLSNQNAFAMPSPNLSGADLRTFAIGNRLFNTRWITAPASVQQFDGLGPTFNRNACSGCHLRDGRGRPPAGPHEPLDSSLLRVSLPGSNGSAPVAVPGYGWQINDRAIEGVPAEARIRIHWV